MIAASLENAGFIDVSVTRLRVDLAYRHGGEAIGAAFLGGPVALPYSRFSDDDRMEAQISATDRGLEN